MGQQFSSSFLQELHQRGFINQCTELEALDKTLATATKPLVAYIGFDGTADSLHVGSLIPIMLLRKWQQHGNIPLVVLGGGTSKVGDPSGKDEARQLLGEGQIASNLASIEEIFKRFLDFDTKPNKARIVNNNSWLGSLGLLDFLREVAPHFSMGKMLGFESVKTRLSRQQNLSFLEFNYMVLQAYDFYHLAKTENCVLQMGGSDQWGNIVCGTELIRKLLRKDAFGLTAPLALSSDGSKMGKTAKGAVWLADKKLTAFDYWQYWRNTSDGDVAKCLRLFSELSLEQIARQTEGDGEALNEAKKTLATEATTLCHGKAQAEEAALRAKSLFEEGSTTAPTTQIAKSQLKGGITAVELFVAVGLVASKGEAKRLIRGGGAKINGNPIADEATKITVADLDKNNLIKLAAGKKRLVVAEAV